MTISSTTNRVNYTGNGVTTAFAFPYKFLANADLKVYQEGTLKTITTHYTVTGAGDDAGGTVTFLVAPANLDDVVIIRDPAILQGLDLVENDNLPAESLENSFDLITMVAQRLDDRVSRAFVLNDADVSGPDLTIPSPVADEIIGWNSAGDALESKTVALLGAISIPVSIAQGGTGSATAADSRSALGLDIGTDVQAYDADIPTTAASQVEMEAGTESALRSMSPLRVAQAIAALATTSESVPVRQTVLSGPVDSSGFSAFGGSTGSTTVTASGTLKATAAAGGNANYTGSIVNPSWTGLSTNGTMFLYLDITSGGVVTTGSTTLEPTYQWGGTYSTTNLQNTFNIQEMTMKVGNGSTASQVYRVFVGEVTVAGSVVTAITWYQTMGRYNSALQAVPAASSSTSFNHNIGCDSRFIEAVLKVRINSAFNGFSAGAVWRAFSVYSGAAAQWNGDVDPIVVKTRTNLSVEIIAGLEMQNGTAFTPGTSNGEIFVEARRTW